MARLNLTNRDQIFPPEAYRHGFERLIERAGERQACRTMVARLAFALERACEAELAECLDADLAAGRLPDFEAPNARFAPDPARLREVTVSLPPMTAYDTLPRITAVATDRLGCARLSPVAPAGRSAASCTTTGDTIPSPLPPRPEPSFGRMPAAPSCGRPCPAAPGRLVASSPRNRRIRPWRGTLGRVSGAGHGAVGGMMEPRRLRTAFAAAGWGRACPLGSVTCAPAPPCIGPPAARAVAGADRRDSLPALATPRMPP